MQSSCSNAYNTYLTFLVNGVKPTLGKLQVYPASFRFSSRIGSGLPNWAIVQLKHVLSLQPAWPPILV